ncbi:MAG TPA: MFS transporter [Solirubrobacteraceae bacterium]|nr:MFS transporter [Solirubrobacteraceae bacterium]
MSIRQTGLFSTGGESLTTTTTAVRPSQAGICTGSPDAPARASGGHLARRGSATLVLASSMVISFLAASAAPTPLYGRYEQLWHATPLIGTIAFAVYALAVLAGLLWLGEVAVLLGRRRILLLALGGQIVALVLFALAGSFTLVLIGRAVQGVAAGAALGVLSATMIESDPERGTIASAASPGAGSGLGAILSGLAVSFLPGPTHTIYLAMVGVMVLQAAAVARLIPRASRRAIPRSALIPRVMVARNARGAFRATAPVIFAVWGLAGFYAALSPALFIALTGSASVWESALGMFLFASVASASTVLLRSATGRALTITGAATMLAGLAVTVVAVLIDSVALYFVASTVVGVGFGAGFQGPIRTLVPLARPKERAGLMSAVFVVAYLGMAIPAVICGALASGILSLTTVTVAIAIALALLSGGALLATVRER